MRVHKSTNLSPLILCVFVVTIGVFGIFAANIQAAVITVTGNGDSIAADGQCTLREAITAANTDAAVYDCSAGAGADTIDFSVSGEIVLNANGPLPALNSDISINAPGPHSLTVRRDEAAANFRIFTVSSGVIVSISGLTIAGGNSPIGGGINNSGNLTLTNTTLSDNQVSQWGGGVFNAAVATLHVANSTVSGNRASINGAGIDNDGALTIEGSTLSGNVSGLHGGGVYNYSTGTTTMRNTTISGNAASEGGGIFNQQFGALTVNNSTVTGNTGTAAAGGIRNNEGTLHLNSSIIANSVAPVFSDVWGPVASAEYSLIENPTALPGANNITGVDPMLGPLQFNGGPTRTHALLSGSPAINSGNNLQNATTDQRGPGFVRVVGSAADIGAFEILPACAGISFGPANSFAVGDAPASIAAGDFNGDGKTDLATASIVPDYVSVHLGNGNGAFAVAVNYLAGDGPNAITTGDFNGDGKIDLATANFVSDNISVFTGNGDGTFAPAVNYAAGDNANSIITGDFNGDGRTDLATTDFLTDSISVLMGNGDGTFAAAAHYPVGDAPGALTAGDLNGDGTPDLAVVNFASGNISMLLANGDGTFAAAVNFPNGGPGRITTGDFNGDGKTDLIATNLDTDSIAVRLGNGNGTFAPAVNYPAGDHPNSITTSDFDGDGKIDLALTNNFVDNFSVLLGNGDGTFAVGISYTVGDNSSWITTGDFNGDGRTDLAVVNFGSDTASVLLNSCAANTAPVANNDSYSAEEDTPLMGTSVLANDTDGEGDGLTAQLESGPVNAEAFTLSADGTFTYTPNANFYGIDFFTYKAHDGLLDSDVVMVTITVAPINDAPTISSTAISRQQAAGSSNSSVASVADIDNPIGDLVVTVNGGASATISGVTVSNVSIDAFGNVTADASAACGASSTMFSLRVSDTGGRFSIATLTVNVTNETTAPVIDPISNVTVYLPLNSPASSMVVNFPLPTATDNCSTPVVTTSPLSGSVFSIGTTTVNVTAKDALNNTSTSSFTVKVLYNFGGFLQPVDPMPVLNIAQAGSSIPVKFSLSGNKGLGILAPGYPIASTIPCDQNEPGSQVEETDSAGNSVLTYDALSDQYKYVWKTNKQWKGTCRILIVKLIDGSEHYAKFRFK